MSASATLLYRGLARRFGELADDWLPAACVVCGSERRGLRWAATGLCAACAAALPRAWARRCPRCGIGMGGDVVADVGVGVGVGTWGAAGAGVAHADSIDYPPPDWPECDECLADPPPFDCTIAAADYLPPLDRLIHTLKFGRDAALARPLGQWLALRLSAGMRRRGRARAGAGAVGPLVTAIPLSTQRLAERGFNQSLEIARALVRHTGLPLATGLLRRPHSAAPAATLDAAERRAALLDAFQAPQPIAGRDVLLVDDVMTTGATLRAAAAALKRAGAAHVVNCVVARTPTAHVQRRSGPP